jgi:hypothetical protein
MVAGHTFGTAAYGATGNLAMVMNVMGHTEVRTAMPCQHRCRILCAKLSISGIYFTNHVTMH